MSTGNRPLSPHLQVYKPQITSVLSILHRITGIGLAVGTLVLVLWLGAIAAGEVYYESAKALITHWFGQVCLISWTWALFYHFCNGIRHMLWDIGLGLEMNQVRISGWFIIFASVLLTLVSWSITLRLFGNL
jgi:succinate dehydrogenase / fumarate reductase cytochrome b subunit